MKTIQMYVTSKYDRHCNVGVWAYYLAWNGAVKKEVGQVENVSSTNKLNLMAVSEALEHILEPCIIKVHSKSELGFKHTHGSVNADLLAHIQMTVMKAGHVFSCDRDYNQEVIDNWEKMNTKSIENTKRIQADIEQREDERRQLEEEREQIEKEWEEELANQAQPENWRQMYSDLMGPSEGVWVPGSGGY